MFRNRISQCKVIIKVNDKVVANAKETKEYLEAKERSMIRFCKRTVLSSQV